MWTLDSEDSNGILGRYASVCVAVLLAPIDEKFVDRLEAALTAAWDEHPGGVSVIVIRASEAPSSMAAPLRDRLKGILAGKDRRLRGFAYVLGGKGLKARLIRGAMGAVLLGASFPGKMFAKPEEAIRWITSLPGQPKDVRDAERELLSTVNGLL